jgi:hypothetical protein
VSKREPANAKKAAGLPTDTASLLEIADRAQDGDKSALPAVRELLKDPEQIDALGGNLARNAMDVLVRKYAGTNLLARESVTRKLDRMRAELGGENPSALEKLLVERVVATWLHLTHLEAIYAGKDSMSLELGGYYQKALNAASRRHLSAIKTLAVVRKLALPALQINVARRQVNIAAGDRSPH